MDAADDAAFAGDAVLLPTEEEQRLRQQEIEAAQAAEAAEAARVEVALASTDFNRHFDMANQHVDHQIRKAEEYHEKMLGARDLTPETIDAARQPAELTGCTLRDYQLEGMQFCAKRYLTNESLILADEMGLGKTVQIIAFVTWLKKNIGLTPILIVGPLSTVGNWAAEFARFSPSIPVVVYRGPKDERRALLRARIPAAIYRGGGGGGSAPARATTSSSGKKTKKARGSPAGAAAEAAASPPAASAAGDAKADDGAAPPATGPPCPVFITSFEIARLDEEVLEQVPWDCLVVDEGHRLKNESGLVRRVLFRFGAMRKARQQKPMFKVLLTGTPVQNDITELFSLCNFVMPEIFGDRQPFNFVYQQVRADSSHMASFYKQQEARNQVVSKLHTLLRRYLLRRTKDQVHLALPPKVETLVYTPLTAVQMRLLRAVHSGSLNEEVAALGWTPSGGRTALSLNNSQILMRQITCHPFGLAEPYMPHEPDDSRLVSTCGKMIVLDKMLRRLRADGHKVLIFSQFQGVLDLLARYLEFRKGPEGGSSGGGDSGGFLGGYRMLSGRVPAEERDQAIREFNNDPRQDIFAFLLSTRAGGLGINLVSADTVIFFDSDWNPKSDEQAMDRAHRIGQVRPVVVYRLVTEGATVEREMVRKAAAKSSLGRMVLQEGAHWMGGIGAPLADQKQQAPVAARRGVGLVDPGILEFWLRRDVSDRAIVDGGISDEELAAILDRARALQAGKRVADAVEGALKQRLAEGRGDAGDAGGSPPPGVAAACAAATAAASAASSAADAAVDAAADAADAAEAASCAATSHVASSSEAHAAAADAADAASAAADAASAAAATASAAAGAANAVVDAVMRSPGAAKMPQRSAGVASPAAAGGGAIASSSSSGSGSKRRRSSPSGGEGAGAGATAAAAAASGESPRTEASRPPALSLYNAARSATATPPAAAAASSSASYPLPSPVVRSVVYELAHWEAAAAAAPFTPSRGRGYEFVYHATDSSGSGGGGALLSAPAAADAGSGADSPLAGAEGNTVAAAGDSVA